MMELNQRLLQLYGQVQRIQRIADQLEIHNLERDELEVRIRELELLDSRRQTALQNLQIMGPTSFLYRLTGRLDDKMAEAKKQADEARHRYQQVQGEMDALSFRIMALEEEQKMLANSLRKYEDALQEKKNLVYKQGGTRARELRRREGEVYRTKQQQREINEALRAGRKAGRMTDAILRRLSGSSEDSQNQPMAVELEELKRDLRRFQAELVDVDAVRELRLQIDSLLRYANDFFGDDFSKWAAQHEVADGKARINNARTQIVRVLDHLESGLESVQEQEVTLSQELEEWLVSL
ncbi:MAG: hypothetical protein IJD21_06625 [Oscillospiraceae bacterium]|nr:hypothetical protein [Oscillospiraceae bacterium]